MLRKAKVGREMLKILKVKNMRYFGHIIRQEGMQKKLLEGKVNGKRPIEEDQEHAEWLTLRIGQNWENKRDVQEQQGIGWCGKR